MSNPDEPGTLRLRPRPSMLVTLSIPSDRLNLIHRVATTRDLSLDALPKFYIGQGLRQDADGNRRRRERLRQPAEDRSPPASSLCT